MVESFENLIDTIKFFLTGLVEALVEQDRTKPNTKLVLNLFQGKKPLLCGKFGKPNKQNSYEINLFK